MNSELSSLKSNIQWISTNIYHHSFVQMSLEHGLMILCLEEFWKVTPSLFRAVTFLLCSKDIFPRIEKDNEEFMSASPTASCNLYKLKESLAKGAEGVLENIQDEGDDMNDWKLILESVEMSQRNWLQAPWIISEFYFYRRIMSCFSYFRTAHDPFRQQKLNGTLASLSAIEEVASLLYNGTDMASSRNHVLFGLLTSLWGNKKDLSLWPAVVVEGLNAADSEDNSPREGGSDTSEKCIASALEHLRETSYLHILDNQLDDATDYLMVDVREGEFRNVGIVVDNAGFELLCDLTLGHILLATGVATSITFHTKKHPTFVSDATTADCVETIDHIANASFGCNDGSRSSMDTSHVQRPSSVLMGTEWKQHVSRGAFRFQDDFFWCQPTSFRSMPISVQNRLASSYITIIKVLTAIIVILYIYMMHWNNFSTLFFSLRGMQTTDDYWMTGLGQLKHHPQRSLATGALLQFVL